VRTGTGKLKTAARERHNPRNQDRLSKGYPHSIANNARDHVNWTTGGSIVHKCDWARRKGLRARNPRQNRQRGSARGHMQKLPTVGKFHGGPSWKSLRQKGFTSSSTGK
jgi:hypothetical protein